MGAPACYDSNNQIIGDVPLSQKQPGQKTVINIPPATNLQTAIFAINALVNLVQNTIISNKPQKVNFGSLVEVAGSRVTQTIRVYNPQDKQQYVDVEQINRMAFRDSTTGETWTWVR